MTCSDDFEWDYFGSSTVSRDGGAGPRQLPPGGPLSPRSRATSFQEEARS
jgi:hypothetical protein